MATKAEKDLYAKLARLGCILCKQQEVRNLEDSPVEMHHIRRFGMRRENAKVIPLCAYHHRLGDSAIHQLGAKGFARYWGITQEDLSNQVEELLSEQIR
jgi:hypothetical protein